MDNYTLFLIKNNGQSFNITQLTSALNWQDSIDTLGMELSFNIAKNIKDKYLINVKADAGDKVILKNNENEVFRGIITDIDLEEFNYGVTCFDYAFYLNKSKTIIQFKKIPATKAIKELCSKFSVNVGNVTAISTQISKIYKDKTIAEIIKDILAQATMELGIKYRLEMREGKLYIEEYKDLVVSAIYKPASNLAKFSILDAIGNITKTKSIQEMKNSIQISSSDEKDTRIVANTKDDSNIKKYGLLQEVISVDKKDLGKANNIAKNKLKELNVVEETISLELLGSDKVRAGRILNITNNEYELSGQYLVTNCSHSYNNSIHKMSIDVRKVI